MLSPKSTDIAANSGTWTQLEKDLWLPILTGSRLYQRVPQNFGDLQTKLNAVTPTSTQAKQLGATLTLIDRLGPVDATSEGSDGKFSTLDNREGLIEYALATLYGGAFWPRWASQSVATPTVVTWR
jgi:hypothetical protein